MHIFDIILSPFIYIIKQIFLLSYNISGNYGLAIIMLSFLISLLLLPIFILIERAKKKDDLVKKKMQPLVDEIKRCYKGQERYYYLKTLNRQHNYSPFRSLIPILSLLLQIPFFIAAYQFLENFEPLLGVSFLFIKDLCQPDGLFGKINFLPIAMTLVNLLTAYFYTRNGNTAERKQMLVVAGIFLILLFKLPAGLVLYWTMNNVFSFFRLFVTNAEVFNSKKFQPQNNWIDSKSMQLKIKPLVTSLKNTFIILAIIAMLGQLNWAFHFNFAHILIRLALAILGSLLFSVLLGLLLIYHKIELSKKIETVKEFFVKTWIYFNKIYIVLAIIAVLSQINWAIQFNFNDIVLRIIGAITASAILTAFYALIIFSYKKLIKNPLSVIPLRIKYYNIKYKIAFYILTLVAIGSQLNWALHFSFDSIIPRLMLSIIGSWAIIIIIAKIVTIFSKLPKPSIYELKALFAASRLKITLLLLLSVVISILSQLNWAWQHSFNTITARLLIAPLLGIVLGAIVVFVLLIARTNTYKNIRISIPSYLIFPLFFLSLYFHFASLYYFNGFHIELNYLASFFVVLTQAVALNRYFKNKKSKSTLLRQLFSSILWIVFVFQMLNLWLKPINLDFLNKTYPALNFLLKLKVNQGFIIFGLIFALLSSLFATNKKQSIKGEKVKPQWLIYVLAVFYLGGFIFLWNPLAIYSSYPAIFEFPAIEILKNNLNLFVISLTISVAIYILAPSRVKFFWLILILSLTAISFINNTLIPINVGTLQENKFVNENNLAQPLIIYLFEGFALVGIIYGIKFILSKRYFKQIKLSLILLNLVLISQSLISSTKTGSFLHKPEIAPNHSNSISFSKNKENIVFVIVDMFHGWYMNRILKEDPILKETFDGFVWYPNTVSVSSITCSSIAPILGGYKYTIDKLNKDNSRTYEDKITEITQNFLTKIKSKNFRFTGTKMIYSILDKNSYDTYLPPWHEDWDKYNSKLNIGVTKEMGYTLLWENAAFYSVPIFIKPKIYNQGRWLQGEVETNENTTAAQPYNFLRLLPYISNTQSNQPNFIYLHSMTSHHPWDLIDEKGKMHPDVTPFENNKWTIETLAKWINWMKHNNAYDNTKIIILSDHGPHWWHFKGDLDMDIPVIPNPDLKTDPKLQMGLYPLLLVKDFGSKGKLKEDWRFMSNADAQAITFDENDPTKKPPPVNRVLPCTIVNWERKIWERNELNIIYQFEVSNNAFNLNNWIIIKK